MTVMKSGRALPLPLKGINVNHSILTGLGRGPQPNAQSAKNAPFIFWPRVMGVAQIDTLPRPEGEARHG